jgi:hypothetical protein
LTNNANYSIAKQKAAKECHIEDQNARKSFNSRTGREVSQGRQIHNLPFSGAKKDSGVSGRQSVALQEECHRRLVDEKLEYAAEKKLALNGGSGFCFQADLKLHASGRRDPKRR